MLSVKISEGLGNQMFQYAYAKALQVRGYDVVINFHNSRMPHGGFSLGKYKIDLNPINHLTPHNIVHEGKLSFRENLLNVTDGSEISGYFQSELYFKNIRDTIVNQFTLDEYSPYAKNIQAFIETNTCTCSIHIRRGDYAHHKQLKLLPIDYYNDAIEYINSKFKEVNFLVFSDDILFAKGFLKNQNITFINSTEKRPPHEDIYLMSLCEHNIIANSSFSWWGAWLNSNKDKLVIAPEHWFIDEYTHEEPTDIVCKSWVKI